MRGSKEGKREGWQEREKVKKAGGEDGRGEKAQEEGDRAGAKRTRKE